MLLPPCLPCSLPRSLPLTAATAVVRWQVAHAREALAAAELEDNPHALRRLDVEARQAEMDERRLSLEASAREAATRQGMLTELQEHFGKRGVQNMLYTLALAQLEASAARYASELSAGRLQLRLSFDDQLRSIRKRVQVRQACSPSVCAKRAALSLVLWHPTHWL